MIAGLHGAVALTAATTSPPERAGGTAAHAARTFRGTQMEAPPTARGGDLYRRCAHAVSMLMPILGSTLLRGLRAAGLGMSAA
jgi:hypothetical protein